MSSVTQHQQVPVTVIGGFLGSGKTTLLNGVLREGSGIRYAVMVNDFGELAIDEMLIREHDGETISFANGCVCCSLGDNLVDSIDKLLDRDPPPEQFLIEVSGVANPKTIADVATLHPRLRRDLIISLVDVSSMQRRMSDKRLEETIKIQLAPADLLVLNKSDLSQTSSINDLKTTLRTFSAAPFITTEFAQLPAAVLSAQGINLDNKEKAASADHHAETILPPLHAPNHEPTQQFWRARVTPHPALSIADIKSILQEHQPSLVRVKGFVTTHDNPDHWSELQFSGSIIDVKNAQFNPIKPDQSVLILIGIETLDELVEALSCKPKAQTGWQATVLTEPSSRNSGAT